MAQHTAATTTGRGTRFSRSVCEKVWYKCVAECVTECVAKCMQRSTSVHKLVGGGGSFRVVAKHEFAKGGEDGVFLKSW